MGSAQIVALSEPTWCDQVLRARPETFHRQSNIAPVFSELGIAGVFSAEDNSWRAQRRRVMFALAQSHLRSVYPKLQTVTSRLKRRWDRSADAGTPFDIVDELKRFTSDVTTLITLGHDINTVEQGDDVIQRKLEVVFPVLNLRIFALLPTWRLIRLPRDRRLGRALAELRAWLSELVLAARAPRRRTRGSQEAVEFPRGHGLCAR
jgi:cytochrome P450